MIILFCVFLVVLFRPDFHPPPFPCRTQDSISDAFGDLIGQIFGVHRNESHRDNSRRDLRRPL